MAALILAGPLAAAPSAAGATRVQWVQVPAAPESATVEVTGLSPKALAELRSRKRTPSEWQELLAVTTEQEALAAEIGLPPMAGSFQVTAKALVFTPALPLLPGLRYRATFYPNRLTGAVGPSVDALTSSLHLPRRQTNSTTVVTQIYPTAAVLPENLLKFYVHFSAPMSRGHIYDHIHLRDQAGRPVDLPFLEIDEELWDPQMKRLTLFIDPGRIKRGVRPLEEVGPALEQGRRYVLAIDRAWRDGVGNPLQASFEKPFSVGPADRTPPDPRAWTMNSPRAGTREALTVRFPDPMDHALALRLIQVMGGAGKSEIRLDGTVELTAEERQWKFTPAAPWQRGPHRLDALSTIEDLAGNNIGKPFEVDVFDGVQRQLTTRTVPVPFEVR